jgi:hypothetical protein
MKLAELKAKIKKEKSINKSGLCPSCQGLGYTFTKFGQVQTCELCLAKRGDEQHG